MTNFEWTSKQRDRYLRDNYGVLTAEDAAIDTNLIQSLVEYHMRHPIIGELSSVVELGVGGALRGPAFMSPLIREGGVLHITDVSKSNTESTKDAMREVQQGELGIWTPHQEHMAACDPRWTNAFGRAGLLGTYGILDVSDLEQDTAEGVSLNYVIESRRTNRDIWRRHIRQIANAAIRIVQLRQTDNSGGYKVGNEAIQALSVTREQTETELERNGLEIIGSYTAEKSGQARQDNDEHPFSGFSGIIAIRP